jgi:ubiquinone/menaquinone biosynthesis C-methylase UbiE
MNLSPKEIVFNFGLMPGMYVADFGAGSGHIVEEVAKTVGRNGLAIAVDINEHSLVRIARIRESGRSPINAILGDIEVEGGSQLTEGAVHGVVISHTLSQLSNRPAALREARRILKSGGSLYLVEDERKIPEEGMKNLIEAAGFRSFTRFRAGENQYGLIAKR